MAKTIPTLQQRQKDMQESIAVQRSLRDIELQAGVLRCALEGKTIRETAAELGVHDNTVSNQKWAALKELAEEHKEATQAWRALEGARLDALQTAVWDRAMGGDLRAIETVLSISSRRRSLFALDVTPAPVPVALTDGAGGPVRFTLAFDRSDGGEEKADTSVIEGESIRLLPAAGEEGG